MRTSLSRDDVTYLTLSLQMSGDVVLKYRKHEAPENGVIDVNTRQHNGVFYI